MAVAVLVMAACSSDPDQISENSEQPQAVTSQQVVDQPSTSETEIVDDEDVPVTETSAPVTETTASEQRPPSPPAWTLEEAGQKYTEAVAVANNATAELNLLGPPTEKNLDSLKEAAARVADAQASFLDVLEHGSWPIEAADAIASLADHLLEQISLWADMSEAETESDYSSASDALDLDTGAESRAARKALNLPAASAPNQIGLAAYNWGATITVTGAKVRKSVPAEGGARTPDQGGIFVIVDTVVVNDAKTSMDLTCGYPIANMLIDTDGRQYDHIESLYELPGNPRCNASLQPGFTAKMRYAYMVPEGVHISGWAFADATDLSSQQAWTFVGLDLKTKK